MSQVEIKVNGREYRVTCEAGQEDRLQKLAAFLDKRVSAMAADLPDISETRLMLLAGLTICDELFEARERAEDLEDAGDALDSETMGGAARAIDAAAKRVNEIAEKLDN
ncbi:MAG: cell division protein ZapA [Parvularcula sp.]|nr:cell division protein ZapA [Parvularcula sp.]